MSCGEGDKKGDGRWDLRAKGTQVLWVFQFFMERKAFSEIQKNLDVHKLKVLCFSSATWVPRLEQQGWIDFRRQQAVYWGFLVLGENYPLH